MMDCVYTKLNYFKNLLLICSDETVASYLNALRKIFAVEDMPAWNPDQRSKTAIRSSDTRYYADLSIATAAPGIGANDLINDLNTSGFIYEKL